MKDIKDWFYGFIFLAGALLITLISFYWFSIILYAAGNGPATDSMIWINSNAVILLILFIVWLSIFLLVYSSFVVWTKKIKEICLKYYPVTWVKKINFFIEHY